MSCQSILFYEIFVVRLPAMAACVRESIEPVRGGGNNVFFSRWPCHLQVIAREHISPEKVGNKNTERHHHYYLCHHHRRMGRTRLCSEPILAKVPIPLNGTRSSY